MSRETTMRRLGAQTGRCSMCLCDMILRLPSAGINICELHWHVAVGFRCAPLGTASARSITCSRECADELAMEVVKKYGRKPPRMRVTVHGPYTPYET